MYRWSKLLLQPRQPSPTLPFLSSVHSTHSSHSSFRHLPQSSIQRSMTTSNPPTTLATPIPPPLPRPRYPAKFTSSLPCDELSALGHQEGDDAIAVPDNLLSTPRVVRKAVYSFVNPEDQSKEAFLLSWNKNLAAQIGVEKGKVDPKSWSKEENDSVVKVLTGGGRRLKDRIQHEDTPRMAYPWAHCYGGHQFGYYAGQLGDGRAISLYETVNPETGESWELQLKGAGKTPYSRFADGYAVLRSSIREYLCAEAVHALGVASSRSLAITSTDTAVIREEGAEPGSIVCRVAPSWIRFGSFEIFYYRKDRVNLRGLAEYVVKEVYGIEKDTAEEMALFARQDARRLDKEKSLEPTPTAADTREDPKDNVEQDAEATASGSRYHNRYAKMFAQVAERTALMVSGWQAIGFCHGVMNTDNMSILGLTIDYGPFAFLDKYDSNWICNHSDTEGRYSFQQQPGICLWNLGRLALTLENLIGAQERVDDLEWLAQMEADPKKEEKYLKEQAKDIVIEILNKNFRDVFLKDYRKRMNEKFGLVRGATAAAAAGQEPVQEDDLTEIVVPALAWMDDHEVDYHEFYRALADYQTQGTGSVEENAAQVELFIKKLLPPIIYQARGQIAKEEATQNWLKAYHARVVQSDKLEDDATRRHNMNKVNPAFVLRNWVAQRVIERVTESVSKTRDGESVTEDADKDLLERVLWMCQHPFVEGPEPLVEGSCEVKRNDSGLEVFGDFVGPVPEWGQGIQCSCSS